MTQTLQTYSYSAVVPDGHTGAGQRIAGASEAESMEALADELHGYGYLHLEVTDESGRTWRYVPSTDDAEVRTEGADSEPYIPTVTDLEAVAAWLRMPVAELVGMRLSASATDAEPDTAGLAAARATGYDGHALAHHDDEVRS